MLQNYFIILEEYTGLTLSTLVLLAILVVVIVICLKR